MNLNDKSKEELVNDLQQLQQSYDSLKQSLSNDYLKFRHIEETFGASEERCQMLFDKAPLGYQSLDFDGFFIEVNQQWLDTLGYQREEVIGKWFGDFLTPAYQEGFRQRFPIFKSQGQIHSEFEMQHKNGSILFIAFEGRIGYDLNGEFKQTHCVLQDITDRKRIEEDLRNSEENLSITLNSIGDGVISTDINGLIVKMNPIAEKLCGWTLKDALGEPLAEVFKIINSESREIVEDPVEKVIKSGEIVGLANHTVLISKSGNEYQIADSAAPIKDKKGEITGVVLVFSDVTEKYIAQKVIYENEKRYSSLLSNLEAGIVVHAPDTAIIMNNVRASELLGLTDDQMRGKTAIDPAWDFINEDNTSLKLNEYPVNWIKTNKEAIKNQILGIKHPQKSDVVWVSVNGFPFINNSGEITEIVISFIDITERKLAEEELKSVKASLELCLEASQIGIWRHDLIEDPEHIKEVSVRDLKHDQIFGYNEKIASWGQEKMLEHVIDEDREATRKAFDNVIEKGRLDFECRILWPDNTIHWIACGGKVYKDSAGQPNQINGTVMDITERKLAEAEFLENKIQFQNLANSGPALIWKSGIDKLCNYFNERWMAFSGRTLEQELGNGWTEGVHPDDFDLCLATYIAAFEKQEPFEMEYRLLHFSGEYRWILDLGTPNYNSKGEFIGYIGNCFDITDRKQAEEKVVKIGQYFRAIIEKAPDGIALIDVEGNFKYISPAAKKMFGYLQTDPISGNPAEFTHPDDLQMVITELTKLIENPDYVPTLEYRFIDKQGNWHWVETTLSNLLADPSVESIVLNFRDITERKLSDSIFKEIIEKNPMSIQILDMEGYPIQVNSAHTKLFGVEPPFDYSVLKDQQLLNLGFGEFFERVKKGEVVYFPDSYYNAHDVDPSFPDSPVWVKALGFTLNDNKGKPNKMVFMHENITERKNAEALLNDIIENNPMSIQIVDKEGHTLLGNPAFLKLFGAIPPPEYSIFEDLKWKNPEMENII
jgi:PAS domain S-box-containing protein